MNKHSLLTRTAPAALFGLAAAALIALPLFGCKKAIADAPEQDPLGIEEPAALTAFKITAPVQAAGVITKQAIAVEVPAGTDVTALKAAATLPDGAAIEPDPKTARDYSKPAAFTVTAADAKSRSVYLVTVRVALAADATITSFKINNTAGQIGESDISLLLPHETPLTSLVPVIEHKGKEIRPASGAAQDFSAGPVTYTVTAQNGATKAYAVTVAELAAGTYAVTYDKNGADGEGGMDQSVFTEGAPVTLLPNGYTRTGYTFAGWKDGAGTPYPDGYTGPLSAPQNGQVILTAQWTANTYTVQYAANPPASKQATGDTSPTNHTYGTPSALAANGFSVSGYTFVEWNTAQDGNGAGYAPGETVSALTSAANGTVTLHAKWTVSVYKVSFNTNPRAGQTVTGEMSPASYTYGTTGALPANTFASSGYVFIEWTTNASGSGSRYANGANITAPPLGSAAGLTLYAQWAKDSEVPALTLDSALAWLSKNAASGGSYNITLNGVEEEYIRDIEESGPRTLNSSTLHSASNVTITLTGNTGGTIRLKERGSLFTIGSGVTLVLGNNISLIDGLEIAQNGNNAAMITVLSGGTLELNDGATVYGGNRTGGDGGGVEVRQYGTFIMNGGEVSGGNYNTAQSNDGSVRGGGVYNNGTFIMNGGRIRSSRVSSGDGGGVFNDSAGTFELHDGSIWGNEAWPYGNGGGVFNKGTFTMFNGEICYNRAEEHNYSCGGGVYVDNGVFTMSGGNIYINNEVGSSSGVHVNGGTFTMSEDARVDTGNDVYLANGKTITVDSDDLYNETVARITLPSYAVNTQVLSGTAVGATYQRFEVSNSGFKVGSNGRLAAK